MIPRWTSTMTSIPVGSHELPALLIGIATPEGQQSGLRKDSVVNCVNLLTLDRGSVLRKLGSLPDDLMERVNICLQVALQLS